MYGTHLVASHRELWTTLVDSRARGSHRFLPISTVTYYLCFYESPVLSAHKIVYGLIHLIIWKPWEGGGENLVKLTLSARFLITPNKVFFDSPQDPRHFHPRIPISGWLVHLL